jgi:hypothetical protein
MIFIKDKRAWKEFVRENSDVTVQGPIISFPCYLQITGKALDDSLIFISVYKSDLQSMLAKLDSGREF